MDHDDSNHIEKVTKMILSQMRHFCFELFGLQKAQFAKLDKCIN